MIREDGSHHLDTGVPMRRALLALVLAASTALLAGCAATGTPAPATAPTPAPAATAPAITPAATAPALDPALVEELGPRVQLPSGILLKQIGKAAMVTGSPAADPADWRVKVTVTNIRVDPKCERTGPTPSRGHRVVVSLNVETSALYSSSDPRVDYYTWGTIGKDDVSEPGVSTLYACNQSKELFTDLRPSSKYKGEVTIDTANTSGRVVWDDGFAWDYSA